MSTTENSTSFHHDDAREEHVKTRPTSTLTESHLLPPSSTHDLNDHIVTVDWDGPDDPENPRKYARHHIPFPICLNWLVVCSWSFSKKWQATIIVSAFTFISSVSSSMIAPASRQLAERFDIHSTVILAMTTSVFVLGYGGYVSFSPQTVFAHWRYSSPSKPSGHYSLAHSARCMDARTYYKSPTCGISVYAFDHPHNSS